MSNEEWRSGSSTPSLRTCQNIVKESLLHELPDLKLFESLQKLSREKDVKKKFLQQQSSAPDLQILCFHEENVELSLNLLEYSGVAFIDGTGNICKKVPGYDSPVELFSLFLKSPLQGEGPIHMADMFLTKKSSEQIRKVLFEPLNEYCM